jgi:hypothetical protein
VQRLNWRIPKSKGVVVEKQHREAMYDGSSSDLIAMMMNQDKTHPEVE